MLLGQIRCQRRVGGVNWVRKRFIGIRSTFMLIAVVLTSIPLLVVGGLSYDESIQSIRSETIKQNLVHAKQLADSLSFLMNDAGSISHNLVRSEAVASYLAAAKPEEKRPYLNAVRSALDNLTFNKPYVYSVYLQDEAGGGFDSRGAVNHIPLTRLEAAASQAGEESWYLDDVYVQNEPVRVLSMIRSVQDYREPRRTIGIVKINVSETSIRELYPNKLQEDNLFYLIDQDATILSSLEPDEIGSRLKLEPARPPNADRSEGHFAASLNGADYLTVFRRMDPPGWNLIVTTPVKQISAPGLFIQKVTLISGLLSIAAGSMAVLLLSRRLRSLMNDVQASKLRQKEAELKALEEQINPHFLYNTLDLIYWMSRMEKAFDTSAMINALSQLFRIGLNRGSRLTTVAQEVEHIRHYMLIQQKRYEETIRFTLEAEPETLECKVVKMVLQPLVENAIVHGIERQGAEGRIDIRIFRDPVNGDLVYRIWDDGAGADEDAVRKMLAGGSVEEIQGIGLRNIQDRIRLQYGSAYGIEFDSDAASGTTVTVRQPFEKG